VAPRSYRYVQQVNSIGQCWRSGCGRSRFGRFLLAAVARAVAPMSTCCAHCSDDVQRLVLDYFCATRVPSLASGQIGGLLWSNGYVGAICRHDWRTIFRFFCWEHGASFACRSALR